MSFGQQDNVSMRFFRILSRRTYTHEGKEHTRWHRIGEIKETDGGGRYLRLYQSPETEFYVVEENHENSEETDAIE